MVYAIYNIFIYGKSRIINVIIILISFYILYVVKIYILLCFIPSAIALILSSRLRVIRNGLIKILVFPFVIIMSISLGYYAILKVGEDNPRYAIETIAETAMITAYDIAYWTGRDAGSTYDIGELDGSFMSMTKLLPQAIIASLFRPYLWEVSNPFMLLSALEALVFLVLTLNVFLKKSFFRLLKDMSNPDVFFCLIFAITFAFAVGVSTFNFGSLVRYKIPMMPFYMLGISILLNTTKFNKQNHKF